MIIGLIIIHKIIQVNIKRKFFRNLKILLNHQPIQTPKIILKIILRIKIVITQQIRLILLVIVMMIVHLINIMNQIALMIRNSVLLPFPNLLVKIIQSLIIRLIQHKILFKRVLQLMIIFHILNVKVNMIVIQRKFRGLLS